MKTIQFTVRALALVAVVAAILGSFSPRSASAQDAAPVTSQTRFECPGCLRPVSPDADRCPECGVSFKKLEYECPKCHATIGWDTTRCPNCGLVFDAPTPGEKEKRAATARSMPDTRDFLKNPQNGEEKPGLEVHGSSLTLFRHGREVSFDGTTTVNRFVQDLNLNVIRLGIPELSFHGTAEFLGDPNLRPGHTTQIQLIEGYFRYESDDEKTQINLGRQYVNSGVTREFIDALFVHHLFGDRFGVEVFGGHPVATTKQDPGGDLMAGTRVYFRGLPKVVSPLFRDLTIAFSAREELWDSRIVREDFGLDFNFSPTWEVDVSGHVYYSAVTQDFYDARGTLELRPTGWMQVTFDYRYVVPSQLLPATSLFVAFADDRRHEVELDVDLWPSERLKLRGYARAYYVPNEKTNTVITNTTLDLGREIPYELGAGGSIKHGQVFKGELGAEAGIMIKGGIHTNGATVQEANVVQFRVYEMMSYDVADKHTLRGSLDLDIEANDGKIYKRQNSAGTITATAGYTYDNKYSATVGGDYRSTPDFQNTGDFFVKLEVQF